MRNKCRRLCSKMKYTSNSLVYITILIVSIHGFIRIESLDESWICKIKKSCVDCLQLEHCSWCTSRNICFSGTINTEGHFCNDTVRSKKYESKLKSLPYVHTMYMLWSMLYCYVMYAGMMFFFSKMWQDCWGHLPQI